MIYAITPSGVLTTLYAFCQCQTGEYPRASLIQATNGNFYGTASAGGAGYGVIFSLSVGLGPVDKSSVH